MMAEIYFTMIVYVDNDVLLKKTLNSISGSMVKIVVVDAICSQASIKLCESYEKKNGRQNFRYIKTPNMSVGEAYNVAIPEIEGRYVNFSLASTWFSAGSLETVHYIAEKMGRPKLISLVPRTVNEKHESVQYKMSPVPSSGSVSEEISLNREPQKLQLMFHAYFIRCYLISSKERHMWFRPELQEDAVMELLCNLLAEIRGYVYLSKMSLNYTYQLEDNFSACVSQQHEWWYLGALKSWILPFAEKWNRIDYPLRTPMRIAIYYLVYARFYCNYNNRNKGVLKPEQVEELEHLTGQIFQYIDSKLIYKKDTISNFVVPRAMRMLFLRLKAECAGKISENVLHSNQLYLWTHEKSDLSSEENNEEYDSVKKADKRIDHTKAVFTIEKSSEEEDAIPVMKWAYDDDTLIPLCEICKEHVIIKTINYKSRRLLEIDGILSLGDFLPRNKIHLFVVENGQKFAAKFSEIYGLEKVFGITYEHKYMFHASVPVFAVSKKSEIQFVIEINGQETILEIRTQSVYAHLRTDVKGQYWRFDEEWCLNIAAKNKMILTNVTAAEAKKMESAFQNELGARAKKGDTAADRALHLRKAYFDRKRNEEGKRIWLTFDKLYKAGDNGEYLYQYISRRDTDIEIYYIVNGDSPDFERLEQEGAKILKWGEDETLVTALLAEVILATHADAFGFAGFDTSLMPYICDLFCPINVCIQHGLTVQNIANFQNRLVDNIQLYLCASPNEIENLSRSIYGYDQESLKLTGLARYDGLKNADKRQILITPTWRRGLAVSSKMGSRRGHSDAFKESEYFHVYNELINDQKLIDTAKKTGYKVIYLLRPVLTSQICDFGNNGYVDIMTTSDDMSYEKVLTESSLMVTDFSGVQFDFAYMRKPILYYHPKELPPHFDESPSYIYSRDAFGPIIDNQEELVEAICDYMKNNCRMKDEYKARADRFFAYSDFNNCERIYNEVLSFLNEEKSE